MHRNRLKLLLLIGIVLLLGSCTKKEACEGSVNFCLFASFFLSLLLFAMSYAAKNINQYNQFVRVVIYILLFMFFVTMIGFSIIIFIFAADCFSQYAYTSIIDLISFVPPAFLFVKCIQNIKNAPPAVANSKNKKTYDDLLDDL